MVWCEGNEFVSTFKHTGKHYQCTKNDFESSESYKLFMTMLSRQKLVDSIFDCVCGIMVILRPFWGGCTYMIFIQFSGNVILSTYFQKL